MLPLRRQFLTQGQGHRKMDTDDHGTYDSVLHSPGSHDHSEDQEVLISKDHLLEQAEENSLKGLNKLNAPTPGILASVFEDD